MTNNNDKNKKIFISHSEQDLQMAQDITNYFILDKHYAKNDIFCSSLKDHGIKPGELWKERIKVEINNCNF